MCILTFSVVYYEHCDTLFHRTNSALIFRNFFAEGHMQPIMLSYTHTHTHTPGDFIGSSLRASSPVGKRPLRGRSQGGSTRTPPSPLRPGRAPGPPDLANSRWSCRQGWPKTPTNAEKEERSVIKLSGQRSFIC